MGDLALLAQRQLNAWRTYALRWHMQLQMKTTEKGHRLGIGLDQWHLVCAGYEVYDGQEWTGCGQTVIVVHDGASAYLISETDIRDAMVDHLRRVHQKIEPTVYEGVEFIG